MQHVVIIPETEWRQMQARLERLEAAEEARQRPAREAEAHADEVLNVHAAAAHIGLCPEQVRRLRRAGKLPSVRLNEKDFGYRRRDLDAYQRRYHRAAQAQTAQAA